MNNKPQLILSGDAETFLKPHQEELDAILPGLEIQNVVFKALDAPTVLELIADVLTWSTVFKAAATVFLSQLAKNAADEVWKRRAELAVKLQEATLRPLRLLSSNVAAPWRRLNPTKNSLRIGIPVPDDHCATAVQIEASSDIEAAWVISNFVLNVEAIQRTAQGLLEEGIAPASPFELKLTPEGQWLIQWIDDEDGLRHERTVVH